MVQPTLGTHVQWHLPISVADRTQAGLSVLCAQPGPAVPCRALAFTGHFPVPVDLLFPEDYVAGTARWAAFLD